MSPRRTVEGPISGEPTPRAVARELREMNDLGHSKRLATMWVRRYHPIGASNRIYEWDVCPPSTISEFSRHGSPHTFQVSTQAEVLPGKGWPFDALACARRLLAGLP